jgi:MYXO-CTERM domain-containing protein
MRTGIVTGALPGVPNGGGLVTLTDLDNDGVADLITGGSDFLDVLRGTGGGSFAPMNKDWGIVANAGGRPGGGFTFGDIDGDGDLDLAGYRVTNAQFNIYRNDLPRRNWLAVRPVGLAGHKGAMGAKIAIYEAGTDKLLWFEEVMHWCQPIQQNYYGLAETERHFGLGDRTTVDVTVHFFPSGKLVKRTGVAANAIVRIGEDGTGTIVPPMNRPSMAPADAGAGVPADARSTPGADGAAVSRADAAPGAVASAADAATGRAPADAGAAVEDEPTDTRAPSSGCGCRVGGSAARPWSGLLVLAWLWARRRRRLS